ncbi:MAG: glycosyltransferase family 4 protein [Acidobacteriota bacterium]
MKIAIDGRTIVRNKTGVGAYAERLVRSLLEIDRKNEYHLFLVEPNESLTAPNLTQVMIPGMHRAGRNRLWENLLVPSYLHDQQIDVYFSPAYALPMLPRFRALGRMLPLPERTRTMFNARGRIKYIVTVHDLIGHIYPEYFTRKMRLWQQLFISNAVKMADCIMLDSMATLNDLKNFYPSADPKKLHVVYPDLDHRFAPLTEKEELSRVRARYSLPEKFVLYVGTVEPRKNVAGLARGYAKLAGTLRQEYPLVIAGGLGWYSEGILSEIAALNAGDSIRRIGYVDDADLPALFNLASVFAFPSQYEGFGYPPLEAMACGIPVISSDRSSLPEAVGDAALIVDPDNPTQIAVELSRILTQPDLRAELKAKGFAQASQFRQNRCARQTLALIEQLCQA